MTGSDGHIASVFPEWYKAVPERWSVATQKTPSCNGASHCTGGITSWFTGIAMVMMLMISCIHACTIVSRIWVHEVVQVQYSRLQSVGTWMYDDLCWVSFSFEAGVGVPSSCNFQAPTVVLAIGELSQSVP